VDAATNAAARNDWAARLGPDVPVIVTSSVTRAGLGELSAAMLHRVPVEGAADGTGADAPRGAIPGAEEALAEHRTFRPAARREFSVERIGDRRFRVSGAAVERLVARYDLDNEDALAHLERRLRGLGVIQALEATGFEAGDDVEIAGVDFELDPGG
jgi:GTP-binding protein